MAIEKCPCHQGLCSVPVLPLSFGPSLQTQAVTPFVLFFAVSEAGRGKEHIFILQVAG